MNKETLPATFAGMSLPQFSIPAARSLQERPTRTLKYGDAFALFDPNGDIISAPGNPEGIFYRDTRHLSHLSLSICDMRPMLLSSAMRDDNAALTCDLTNPDLYRDGDQIFEHDLIHLRRVKFLWKTCVFERIAIRNFSDKREHIVLQVDFAADFADLFEVRGSHRKSRGKFHPSRLKGDKVILTYTGLDGRVRETQLRFAPMPRDLNGNCAIFDFELEPLGTAAIFIEVRCESGETEVPVDRLYYASLRESRRALRRSASRATAILTSNDVFNVVVQRSISDLYMLATDLPEGPYPYAGIPWFSTVFGRDALITALQTLWVDPLMTRGVLGHLAATQATAKDDAADAEPGKILHEARHGEMAQLGEVPFRRYYGSVDSTPLFVMLAGAYLERTGNLDEIRQLWPNIEAALRWIDVYGDRDRDGFVEYGRKSKEGLANQGWKDSHDSVFHADGKLAQGPIALVEVQGYVFAAKRAGALMARRLGFAERASTLEREAEELRALFNKTFWDDDLGTYVLALDGDKRPCRVRSSNAGHALFTGIAAPDRARRVADELMRSASFSGWGIRTIAASESRYNPMSYHNGSVWPHDNALIALGFARYGMRRYVNQVFKGLFEASTYIELRRLPELMCGFVRMRTQGPTSYPVACSPQAWAAATPLGLLQASMGLRFDPENRHVIFDRPVLPGFLNEVKLTGLAIADAKIDVQLLRTGTDVAVNVISRKGDIWATSTS
ncbi:MAG TPA: amylo-alpha-1,6-glucosidase [Methylovirgula sp.]|nr:amylo-alpha-1,6-glucosidase [Methylovirgula sp.]